MLPERRRQQIFFTQESLTLQAPAEECDINNILRKYNNTSQLTHVNKLEGSFGDFSDATDYQSSYNAILDANDRFMGLPAELRLKFNNDPATLIDFISDSQNYDKAIELGLIDSDRAKSYLAEKEAKNNPPLPSSSSSLKSNSSKTAKNDD